MELVIFGVCWWIRCCSFGIRLDSFEIIKDDLFEYCLLVMYDVSFGLGFERLISGIYSCFKFIWCSFWDCIDEGLGSLLICV